MKLAVDLSKHLIDLSKNGQIPVDYIEVGPWFTPEEICAYRQELPGYQFLFHASEQIFAYSTKAPDAVKLKRYLECTESPWVSAHLVFNHWWRAVLALRGVRLPDLPAGFYARRFVRKAQVLARQVDVPLVFENLALAPQAEPKWINYVLNETGCNFLLDLGHVRVAADWYGMSEHDYLSQLPFEKVVAIHVSGSRVINGRRRDAHEPLVEEDYELLEWAMERTHAQILTLEYTRELEPLSAQISRLDRIVHDGG